MTTSNPPSLKTCGKGFLPIEGVDAVLLFQIQEAGLLAGIEIRADERVAALDVATEVGEGALLEETELLTDGLLVFAFEHFEQQGELGDFDGLGVDVDAVDVVEQDALAFGGGEAPVDGVDLDQAGF